MRGGFHERNDSDLGSLYVPTVSQVVPGAPVSIVLKVDQPTGRQIQGIVAELLTRGNHPRGIKVRLQDGRVGRVQRMASDEEAKAGSAGLSGLGRNGESGEMGGVGVQVVSQLGGFTANKYSDFRVDAPDEPPRSELSLEDYVVVKGNKKKGRRKEANGMEPSLKETDARKSVV